MPTPEPERLYQLLHEIEIELRNLSLWNATPPPAEAFESELPFFADRMDFAQWLQWVFLTRFRALLDGNHALPTQCDIAPMAEEALKTTLNETVTLISLLREFDQQF